MANALAIDSSVRIDPCARAIRNYLGHRAFEQGARLRLQAEDTGRRAGDSSHAAERADEEQLLPQRGADILGNRHPDTDALVLIA